MAKTYTKGITQYDIDKLLYGTDIGEVKKGIKGDLECTVWGKSAKESDKKAVFYLAILNSK